MNPLNVHVQLVVNLITYVVNYCRLLVRSNHILIVWYITFIKILNYQVDDKYVIGFVLTENSENIFT